MPIIHRTVFLGHDLALFLPDHDWKRGLEITFKKETILEAGQTGRENRTPKYVALRHELNAFWTLDAVEAQELQTALIDIGVAAVGERVYIGLPIYCDQLELARWGERIFDAQFVVNYDATGFAIYAKDEALPNPLPHTWCAPLIVGRLSERPKLQPTNRSDAQLTIKLKERSPWDFRIAPAPEPTVVIGDAFPNILEVDLSDAVEDSTIDGIEYKDIGDGRVEAVDGQERLVTRKQVFRVTCDSRVQIRALLNFFLAKQGRGRSFDADWFHQPGADTAQTPHVTRVRFAEDQLTLKFLNDQEAQADIAMVQVPWEAAATEGETPEQDAKAYFYRYRLHAEGGDVYWRYTNWEHDLVRTEDGAAVTYKGDVNALMRHDGITHTIDLSDDPVSLTSWIFAENPLLRVMQRTLDGRLEVEIFEGPYSNPDAAESVYTGDVIDAENEGRALDASTEVFGGLLDIKVPNFFFGPICNYQLCGPGCNTLNAMPPEAWTFSGTIVAQAGADLTVEVVTNPPAAALTDDWFARGWVKSGASATYEIRQIVRSVDLGSGRQLFRLKKALRMAVVGGTVTFRPYCTGTRDECENKFHNYINMGAHPHIGSENLSVPSRSVSQQTGKK